MDDLLARRYRLGRVLGAGGMARVLEATDTTLGRRVAVKVLDADAARTADPAGRERFLREARSLAAFTHPHVVTLFDAGEDGGLLYLVMEHVAGGNLAEVIARDAPVPPTVATSIAADVLAGLHAAHEAGLVHRDVKPANVLLTRDGVAKLADFGIAKQLDDLADSLTATGLVVGTRHYVAPEHAAGADATPASDVYAVGVLLHELLTGRRPDPGGAIELADSIPTRLRDTVRRALSPDPASRFASAADMARQLGRELEPTRLHLAGPGAGAAIPTAVDARTLAYADGPAHPGPDDGTRVATAPPASRPTGDARRWWPAAAVVGAVIVIVSGALLLADQDRLTSTPVRDPARTAPATGAPPPASTVPPTTATAPPTTPPTTLPVTTASELVPGFATPADLASFIAELRDERDVAGKEAKKLADRLEELAERRDRLSQGDDDASARDKLLDEADEIREDVADWIDEGKLHPEIGQAAIELVGRLVDDALGRAGG